MAQDDLLNQVKAAIHQYAQQPDGDLEALLKQVDTLFDQHGIARDPNGPDLAGIAIGRELDDYDHEQPESEDIGDEAQDMEAGTLTEVGARTASPFGGEIEHAGEKRYGGVRPASMGPIGGPIEQHGRRTHDEQKLGDRTDDADRLFANRSVDREDPVQDPEETDAT